MRQKNKDNRLNSLSNNNSIIEITSINGRAYYIIECEVCNVKYQQQARLFEKAKYKNRCSEHRKKLIKQGDKFIIPKTKDFPNEKCLNCGKPIWRGSKRCKSCAQKGYKKDGTKIIIKYCKLCGKKLSKSAKNYCLKCWNKKQDKGLSRERTKFANSAAWQLIRKKCFERDNYTCTKCGLRNKRGLNKSVVLNAHHIKSYKHYPELRLELDNIITLCEDCHYKVHREDVGEKRSTSKLKNSQVKIIKQKLSKNISRKTISREFGVSVNTIRDIDIGKTWSHI